MTDLAAFPDVELALVSLLADLARTGTQTPANVEDVLPFLRVACYGGSDDRITDMSRVDVDAFAATKAAASMLAEVVRQRLTGRPHLAGGAVLDRVRTGTKPHYVSYVDNPPPWRYTAAYSITARRPVSTS